MRKYIGRRPHTSPSSCTGTWAPGEVARSSLLVMERMERSSGLLARMLAKTSGQGRRAHHGQARGERGVLGRLEVPTVVLTVGDDGELRQVGIVAVLYVERREIPLRVHLQGRQRKG